MLRYIFLPVVLLLSASYMFGGYPDAEDYSDPVVYAETTLLHRLVVTERNGYENFFIDGNLVVSSADSYRFFETLVHTPFCLSASSVHRVLFIGDPTGYDLAELVKYKDLSEIVVLGLDREVPEAFDRSDRIVDAASNAMDDPRLKWIYPGEGMEQRAVEALLEWLREAAPGAVGPTSAVPSKGGAPLFDLVIVNASDPVDRDSSALYSDRFYSRVARLTSPGGTIITPAGASFFTPGAIKIIENTLATAFPNTTRMSVNVPSIGEWSFIVGSKAPLKTKNPSEPAVDVKFLNREVLLTHQATPRDRQSPDDRVNSWDNPVLYKVFLEEWGKLVKSDIFN